jgi:hypothetical protein
MVPTQARTLTDANGNGWQTGPAYANVAVADVVVGHVAAALPLVSSTVVGMPGATWTGAGGEKPNALGGWAVRLTVAVAVPLLPIVSVKTLLLSAG